LASIQKIDSGRSSLKSRRPAGRKLQHDGSVVFYKYNERGLETERATFPTSFATATTRQGLARAISVVSIQWHGIYP